MAKRKQNNAQPEVPGRPRRNVVLPQEDDAGMQGANRGQQGDKSAKSKGRKNRNTASSGRKPAAQASRSKQTEQADIRRSGRVLNRGAGEESGQPPGRRTNFSRVPSAEAFDHVKRMPPPNLPGRQGGGTMQQEAPPSAKQRQAPPGRPTKSATPAGGAAGRKAKATPQAGEAAPPNPKRGKRAAAQEETGGTPAKQPRRRPSPAKRRRNRRIAAIAGLVVLIALGVWFSIQVLFKIDKFEVVGESRYTEEEIIAAFGGEAGDSMMGFSAGSTARRMQETLPYLEQVTIRRRLPGTVVFEVTPAVEKYTLSYEGRFAVLSTGRKVLALTDTAPDGLILIEGLAQPIAVPGQPLAQVAGAGGLDASAAGSVAASVPPDSSAPASLANDAGGDAADAAGDDAAPAGEEPPPAGDDANPEGDVPPDDGATPEPEPQPEADTTPEVPPAASGSLATLEALLDALDESGLTGITFVNVADELDLRFGWQGRITVVLGARGGMDKKMAAVTLLLTDPEQSGITEGDRGTLDASNYLVTNDIRFIAE